VFYQGSAPKSDMTYNEIVKQSTLAWEFQIPSITQSAATD
jgi:hypothetical protein